MMVDVVQRLVHGTDLVGPVDPTTAPQQRVALAHQRQQRLLATAQVRLVFRLRAQRSPVVSQAPGTEGGADRGGGIDHNGPGQCRQMVCDQ